MTAQTKPTTADLKAMLAGITTGGWNRNVKPASHYPVIFAGRNTHVAQIVSKFIPEAQQEANCDAIAQVPALLAEVIALREALALAEATICRLKPTVPYDSTQGTRDVIRAALEGTQ